uniref:Uncharacterized protein n=1 Tax=Plectus sambesii TaxID=2011161 RepID=A0A914VHM4_9BILA
MACGGDPGGKKPNDYFSCEFEPTSDGKKVLVKKQSGESDALTERARSAGAYQRPPDVVLKMNEFAAMIAAEKAKDCRR